MPRVRGSGTEFPDPLWPPSEKGPQAKHGWQQATSYKVSRSTSPTPPLIDIPEIPEVQATLNFAIRSYSAFSALSDSMILLRLSFR